MNKKTVRDIDVAGKRVFLRVDYNVQFADDNGILDDFRLRESLPTLHYLIDQGARIIIAAHRGRPGGQVVEELRNEPVAEHLSKLLGQKVKSVDDCIGPEVEAAAEALQPGEVLLLENVRFHPGEEENDPQFAKQLAALADVFVSDAFGTAHRAHASVVGVGYYLPAVAGLLMERELEYLTHVAEDGERPMAVILGGSKVADKIGILKNVIDRASVICVGGGVANTFLRSQGIDVGASLYEPDRIEAAHQIMRLVSAREGVRMMMPTDVVVSDPSGQRVNNISVNRIPPGFRILDLGRQTLEDWREALQPMRTVVWNGPVGFFEHEPFDQGSLEVARMLADLVGATTVAGGGETAAAIAKAGVSERISHVSTGGGASLQMMQGESLPGVEILREA